MKLAIIFILAFIFTLWCGAQQPSQPSAQSKPVASTPTALSEIQQRAAAGDAEAQFELGQAYEQGKAVAQDDEKAVEWFRKAADQGNAKAQNSLGVMYALGHGVTRDREEAVRWYKKAAKSGSPDGMYNVAISYYNGEGVDSSMDSACTWMRAAQQKGDAQAADALKHIEDEMSNRLDRCKYDLAISYEKGEELPRDMTAAIALYTETAKADPKRNIFKDLALLKLCRIYASGEGVQQDFAEARSWCKKSSRPEAFIALGRMTENGLGSPKDTKEAMEYYRKAALGGAPGGFMEVGRLRAESGTHEGLKQAYFWYAIAAKFKHPGAEEKLKQVVARLSDKETAEASKQVTAWLKLPVPKRNGELKKH